MSYDIRIAVRGEPDNRFYVVFEPEIPHPTYNIGTMLRKSMNWDFKQGEFYRVSEVLPNIERGLHELNFNPNPYKEYQAENGWGTIRSGIEALQSILDAIKEHIGGWDWNTYDIEYLWIAW